MGVYYDASIAWGLLVPDTGSTDLTDIYDLPRDMRYIMGGDFMYGEGMANVVHPIGASSRVLDSSSEGFGVFAVDDIYTPTDEDYQALRRFADNYDLEPKIGWFAISSVG